MIFLKKIFRQILPFFVVKKYDDLLNLRVKSKEIETQLATFNKHSESLSNNRFECNWEDKSIKNEDKTTTTQFDAHYLYHPAWAARKLNEIKPKKHIDISSYLDFSTLVSAFIDIDFYDLRPAKIQLSGLTCSKADATNLPFKNNSIESISCMHVIEHIGLGRYGDKIDPEGDIKAIDELKRVTKDHGHIYFAVPIGGTAKIQFNAHRIYTYSMVLKLFEKFDVIDFSLITDSGEFFTQATQKLSDQQKYGCGCFLLKKNTD